MSATEKPAPVESDVQKRNVDNYSSYIEGDVDPATGKSIARLITSQPAFIVYLDDNDRTEWSVTQWYEEEGYSGLYGEVVNKVVELEGMSEVFSELSEVQKKEYRLLLGNAIARMLERSTVRTIRQAMRTADSYLKSRMLETARVWYLSASFVVAALALLTILLIWLARQRFVAIFGEITWDFLMAIGMGAFGALVSVVSRSNHLSVNVSAGKPIHQVEGAVRVVLGMLGALLVGLAVKGNLLLGAFGSTTDSFLSLLAICFVAGASERLAPSIIQQVEGLMNNDGESAPDNQAAQQIVYPEQDANEEKPITDKSGASNLKAKPI